VTTVRPRFDVLNGVDVDALKVKKVDGRSLRSPREERGFAITAVGIASAQRQHEGAGPVSGG